MPYVFSTRYEYKGGNYEIDFRDAFHKFPFLDNRMVSGEILATYVENKVTQIRRPFKFKVTPDQKDHCVGRITEPNPLKEKGVPPCELCVALYKYEEFRGNQPVELPIMENQVIKGSTLSYFDDIVKRISKEEEIRIMIETMTFHHGVKSLADTLRDAYLSFEEERYSHTKTSCRKILENLRNQSKEWKTIDGSKGVCDKLKSVLNSAYSFASPGGPHEGICTRDETEFIIKAVAGVLFYVNNLLKSDRIVLTQEQTG